MRCSPRNRSTSISGSWRLAPASVERLVVLGADEEIEVILSGFLLLRALEHDPPVLVHERLHPLFIGHAGQHLDRKFARHLLPRRHVPECDGGLSGGNRIDEVGFRLRDPTDVPGLGEFLQELPSRAPYSLVAAGRKREREKLQVRVDAGTGPADLALEFAVEQLLDLFDLDRSLVGCDSPRTFLRGCAAR